MIDGDHSSRKSRFAHEATPDFARTIVGTEVRSDTSIFGKNCVLRFARPSCSVTVARPMNPRTNRPPRPNLRLRRRNSNPRRHPMRWILTTRRTP